MNNNITNDMINAFSVKIGSILTNIFTYEKYEVMEILQYINPLYYPPLYAYKLKNINTDEIKTIKVEDYEEYGIENWDKYKTEDGKPWFGEN